MDGKYHCFWVEPVFSSHKHEAFDDLASVLALVKENGKDPDEYRNVRNLVVIWGEQIEFEPATFVESYRIKEKLRK